MANYKSYAQYPFSFINGFELRNNSTSPNFLIDVTPGITNDSTNTFSIQTEINLQLNILNTGVNGLDTGSATALTGYFVYLIWDAVESAPVATICSLSKDRPALPYKYSCFKLIGYIVTDSSSHILTGEWTSGNSGNRKFYYNYAQDVLSGNASSPTAFGMYPYVPAIDRIPVYLYAAFVSVAAGNNVQIKQLDSSSGFISAIISQAASVQSFGLANLVTRLNSNNPSAYYSVTNGSTIISVLGYDFFV